MPFTANTASGLIGLELGRQLSHSEMVIMANLSAQGVAKVNRDLLGGRQFEMIMSELQIAFQMANFQRHVLGNSMPLNARALIQKLPRKLSIAELVLLASSPELVSRCETIGEKEGYADIPEILEHFALIRMDSSQTDILKNFCSTLKLPCSVQFLAPTTWPAETSYNGPSHTHSISIMSNKLQVGLNPVVSWFLPGDASPIIEQKYPVPKVVAPGLTQHLSSCLRRTTLKSGARKSVSFLIQSVLAEPVQTAIITKEPVLISKAAETKASESIADRLLALLAKWMARLLKSARH